MSSGTSRPGAPVVLDTGTKVFVADDLEAVARTINDRPRKVLGRKTPADVFAEQLLSRQQPDVASTG